MSLSDPTVDPVKFLDQFMIWNVETFYSYVDLVKWIDFRNIKVWAGDLQMLWLESGLVSEFIDDTAWRSGLYMLTLKGHEFRHSL